MSFLDANASAKVESIARPFLDAHRFWIRRYPSLYSSANNHRVAELVAQFLAAQCAPGLPDATALLRESRDGLEDRMQHLFHDDGVGAEQSVTYGAYALEWFALAGAATDAARSDFSAEYKMRARNAAEHLRWLMDDAARTPAIGDGDETRVLALSQEPETRYAASVVSLVARWLDAPELMLSQTDIQLRDLWGNADIASARSQFYGMRVFEPGGYTVIRDQTPSGTLVCVFGHGPLGFASIAAHGHADALSIWLSWGDEPIFVDAGTCLYHSGGTWRDHFRSTRVHNTLALENSDQSTIAGPFNWARHANARIVEETASSVTAEHDGYMHAFGLTHRRTVRRVYATELAVEDELLGRPARTGLNWNVGFTLAPGITVSRHDGAVQLTTPGGRRLRLEEDCAPESFRETLSPFSPSFSVLSEAHRLTFSGSVDSGGSVMRLRIACLPDE
jgi:hypothetical protein